MTTTWVCCFTGPLFALRSVVRGDAALGDPAGDERIQLFADRRIHGRRLVRREQLLPDPVRLARHFRRTRLLPGLEVAPVAEHRLVERRPIAALRVLGAEEVAARTDVLHRLEGE